MAYIRRFLLACLLWQLAAAVPRISAELPELGTGGPREHLELGTGWRTIVAASGSADPAGFASLEFDDRSWREVDVPHNWDAYAGYRQAKHGNLHGTAWYRLRFKLDRAADTDRRVFLFFEGVGSYATVWLNGRRLGAHAGGLTTFTLDATEAVRFGAKNVLAVRVDHPEGIRDLPWVCGGCERAYGFSEGSEPFGIFRPVHVLVTHALRIAPFGVHVWNDRDVTADRATAHLEIEASNHGTSPRTFVVRALLLDREGATVARTTTQSTAPAGGSAVVHAADLTVSQARLWALRDPYLYTVRVELVDTRTSSVLDRVDTPYGFRWIEWPNPDGSGRGTFLLNGEPTFLQGTCEYPNLLGGSHAFSAEQIRARVRQIEAAGFNGFRDAHHPHNLRYQEYWDADGLTWWPQFGAHIWFDRDDFRASFLSLLRDWVKERRNSPSLVLWGLQNESQLPTEFARAATAIIRELDPTAGSQRLVTTCNGGSGTDWDVPQNWTGTYGGDPATYANDLRRQRLVGEYGAWRSIDLHESDEGGSSGFPEEPFNRLLETKLRLADTVRGEVAGQFHWLFATHDNPGRTSGAKGEQIADGWSQLDRLGPANNKGLLTLWGEPLDAYYLFRSHNVAAATAPMVELAGSTAPDRWTAPGTVNGIVAYSNCDEVELFNDAEGASLGVRRRDATGHFHWDGVALRWNLLRAVARQNGRDVAGDAIVLHHLPDAPRARKLQLRDSDTTGAAPDWEYVRRVNCGGPEYRDVHGATWSADQSYTTRSGWGSRSWARSYPDLDPDLGSVRRVNVPISGTRDPQLYRTFRYGRNALSYRFDLPNGRYRVELHFVEPWYGRGNTDASGWRLFDVALNGRTVARNLDLWKEAGYAHAVKKIFETEVADGKLEIAFPRVASYQAVISAIAIARPKAAQPLPATRPATPFSEGVISALRADPETTLQRWLNTGDRLYSDSPQTLVGLPEELRNAAWLQRRSGPAGPLSFTLERDADLIAALLPGVRPSEGGSWENTGEFLKSAGAGGTSVPLWRSHHAAGATVTFSAAPELVVLLPTRPLPPAEAIRNLVVTNSREPRVWNAAGNLRRGARLYGPAGPMLNQAPAELTGSDWLVTPPDERSSALQAQFDLADHADVYVALDRACSESPAWLSDWEAVRGEIEIGTARFQLFRRHFSQGDHVVLGPNGHSSAAQAAHMYGVFVRPTRPATTYAARPDSSGTLVLDAKHPTQLWPITVGVGDRYRLALRLRPMAAGAARVRYELMDSVGNVLCSEETQVTGASWQMWRLRTCTSINAGSYRVELTWFSGTSVEVESLTVE